MDVINCVLCSALFDGKDDFWLNEKNVNSLIIVETGYCEKQAC